MGRKLGMTQVFDEKAGATPCTLIQIEENVVVQIKDLERDGYSSIQLGFEKLSVKDPRTLAKRMSKPLLGHFRSADVLPRRFLREQRLNGAADVQVGQTFGAGQFEVGQRVDVRGVSKGKGYQGVMKLYNFRGIGSSHGAGPVHRHGGSRGQRSTPGRVFPGNKAAGRMGGRRTNVQNLRVVAVDADRGLLCLRGAVPGSRNTVVAIRPAIKTRAAV